VKGSVTINLACMHHEHAPLDDARLSQDINAGDILEFTKPFGGWTFGFPLGRNKSRKPMQSSCQLMALEQRKLQKVHAGGRLGARQIQSCSHKSKACTAPSNEQRRLSAFVGPSNTNVGSQEKSTVHTLTAATGATQVAQS